MKTQQDMFSGESLKAAGTALVAEYNEEWIDAVLVAIKRLAGARATFKKTFTVEDVRMVCKRDGIRQPQSPNAWGAAFSAAAKQGLIVRVGYTKNNLASAHARVVAVWMGKQ